MHDFREDNLKLRSQLRSMAMREKTEETDENKHKKKFDVLLKIDRALPLELEHGRLRIRYQPLDDEKRQLEWGGIDLLEYVDRLERKDVFLQNEIKRLCHIMVFQDDVIGKYCVLSGINFSQIAFFPTETSLSLTIIEFSSENEQNRIV